jgi:hypothetical protein
MASLRAPARHLPAKRARDLLKKCARRETVRDPTRRARFQNPVLFILASVA